MELVGAVEEEHDGLGDAQQAVEQRAPRQPLIMNIRLGKGSASSVPSTPSPRVSTGKDTDLQKAASAKEMEEERSPKAEKDKKSAKAGKRKEVTPSSSSCSVTTSSSEEEEPSEKIKVKKKGKKATQKAPAKVPSKTQIATKPKGKRPLEEPA